MALRDWSLWHILLAWVLWFPLAGFLAGLAALGLVGGAGDDTYVIVAVRGWRAVLIARTLRRPAARAHPRLAARAGVAVHAA
jgi:hypothetical protein